MRRDAKTVTGEPVSPNKLAVMTSHASMAFIATKIRKNASKSENGYNINLEKMTNDDIKITGKIESIELERAQD